MDISMTKTKLKSDIIYTMTILQQNLQLLDLLKKDLETSTTEEEVASVQKRYNQYFKVQ